METSSALIITTNLIAVVAVVFFFIFLFGSAQAFNVAVVTVMVYFPLAFVAYLRGYAKEQEH